MPQVFDYIAKEGDTAPIFPDTLAYTNGQPADLSGATVTLVLRTRTGVAITLPATVINATLGQVQYTPTASTVVPAGYYMGLWVVQFASTQMSFPTQGYLNVRIEENLTSTTAELVSVADAKDYLDISGNDRTHDAKLARFIAAARPTVEDITGPVIPTVFDEWHRGGGGTIQLRRTPSTTYSTSPILSIVADGDNPSLGIKEYWGTQEHPLTVVANPGLGSTYSCMIDGIGTITRLTSGGGRGCFTGGESVHVIYLAGQSAVPPNVYEGTLELIRVNYRLTSPSGDGRYAQADDQDSGPPPSFHVPPGLARRLAPNRRAPSTA